MQLTCPIRGLLKINDKAKDEITYSEEYRRIEAVRFLLELGIPKECFDFEKSLWQVGNSGRNNIRADIVIYENSDKNKIFLIAEIKRDSKDKQKAIKNQLEPVLLKWQCQYGIYYDGVENVFFTKNDNYKVEHSLLKFPKWGFNFNDNPLRFNDLVEIKNINAIILKIEQLLHNIGKSNEEKYKELFKIILCKYYDEKKQSANNGILEFQSKNNLQNALNSLYSEALFYYEVHLDSSINIKENTTLEIVNLLQNYSFLKSKQDILQTLFMKFASYTLKTELAQFFTPISLVEFIISLLEISSVSKIIDPSGGSADFLIGTLKQNPSIAQNIYYWDYSQSAAEVARLNMILNGDGRTNISVLDSIENYNLQNNSFDFAITNPPFGEKTIFNGSEEILSHYELFRDYGYKQLGVLFIERNLNLLKENGILCIILPNGYLNNPKDRGLREFILKKSRIIGYISMPEGIFKASGAGVKTGILILQKQKEIPKDYKIFSAVANEVGFDFHSKSLNPLYRIDLKSGEYLLDSNNDRILLSDFEAIAKSFRKFAYDENLSGFKKEICDSTFEFFTKNALDKNLIINAEANTQIYKQELEKVKSLKHANLQNAEISNKLSFVKNLSEKYSYIDISNLENGSYLLDNVLYGWQLPNRAKQSVEKYDIVLSKLKGSFNKFCMILHENTKNTILTNGAYRVRIKDELTRLSFYKFLFSDSYKIQAEALATGSIMLDIKETDLKEKIIFTLLDNENFHKMREFIKAQEEFIVMRSGI